MDMDGGATQENLESQALERARAGDQHAFRHLVDVHARGLFQLCFRITRDSGLAEDAVQEALYKAWRALDSFDGRAAFSTWLHRIAVNAALEQLRRNARHRHHPRPPTQDAAAESDFLVEIADPAPGPEALASGTQVGEHIGKHMEKLSPVERAAFVMRHFEGERLEAIETALSLNTGQCKQAIFRAVRKLRRALEPLR